VEQGKPAVYDVGRLIEEARRLAAEYRRATGKPLPGVSAEIAEHDCARLLGLALEKGPGYDALGRGARAGRRIQIKGRVIFDERKSGQRLGQLRVEEDWDSVMLVLMDENYETYEIHEAERGDVLDAVAERAGSKRARRGALSVAKFRAIGRLVWTREDGEITDEVWDNRRDP